MAKNKLLRRELTADENFTRFWAMYPRRVARQDALKAWAQLKLTAMMIENIFAALEWQIADFQWTKENVQWIPYPASWLRGRRWEDERLEAKPKYSKVTEAALRAIREAQ